MAENAMGSAERVRTADADPGLLAEIRKYGKFDVNGCFGCGTCTLSCDLSSDLTAFPRRSMRIVLLGLRDELHSSLEPWLCHDCGDCTRVCPRQADPARSMMTLRRYLTARYDWTGLARRFQQSRVWEVGALLVVGALVLLLGWLAHRPSGLDWLAGVFGSRLSDKHPCVPLLVAFDWLVLGLMTFFGLSSVFRMYWLTLGRARPKVPVAAYFAELRTLLFHFGSQAGLLRCENNIRRWGTHLALASGCVLMFVLVFLFLGWFQSDRFLPIWHPQRWLGYIATVAIMIGSVDALLARRRPPESPYKAAPPADWLLPVLLLLTAVSGILIHILRYTGHDARSWDLYAAHMVIVVPMLLVELPFSSWGHMFYRPLALYFAAVKARAETAAAGEAGARGERRVA